MKYYNRKYAQHALKCLQNWFFSMENGSYFQKVAKERERESVFLGHTCRIRIGTFLYGLYLGIIRKEIPYILTHHRAHCACHLTPECFEQWHDWRQDHDDDWLLY